MIVIPVVLFPSPSSLQSSPVDSLTGEEPQYQVSTVNDAALRCDDGRVLLSRPLRGRPPCRAALIQV